MGFIKGIILTAGLAAITACGSPEVATNEVKATAESSEQAAQRIIATYQEAMPAKYIVNKSLREGADINKALSVLPDEKAVDAINQLNKEAPTAGVRY